MDRVGVIFAGVAISALGAMTYNLLPLFLGTAQDFRALSDQSVGILGSSFYAGFTLATITAYFWIRRCSWRVVSFSAIPIAAGALVAAGLTQSYLLMAIAIAVAGGAFSVLYGIGTTVLGDTSRPARWYGLKIASEAGLGAILLLILPGTVIQRWGFTGLMAAMAIVLLVLSPLLAGLPARGSKGAEPTADRQEAALAPALRFALWLGLAAVLVYLFCTTMIWAFVERVANDAGFDAVATGNVLSLSLVLAICGSLAAMVLGDRFGLALPLTVAASLLLASLVLLGGMDSLATYAVATCLFTFSFGLGIPYTVSVVADLDVDGRFVVLTVPAIGIGVMLAPALGGILTGIGGHAVLLMTGAVSVLIALALALLALRMGLPHARAHRHRAGGEPAEPIV
jgi:predicted MFS family arabinose efflux permease